MISVYNVFFWIGVATVVLILSWLLVMGAFALFTFSSVACLAFSRRVDNGRVSFFFEWLHVIYYKVAKLFESRINPVFRYHPIEYFIRD